MNNFCPRISNFTPFRSRIRRFRDTGHFETSAPNDPKMTLNYTRSNVPMYVLRVPHFSTLQGQMYPICITTVPGCYISLRFAL